MCVYIYIYYTCQAVEKGKVVSYSVSRAGLVQGWQKNVILDSTVSSFRLHHLPHVDCIIDTAPFRRVTKEQSVLCLPFTRAEITGVSLCESNSVSAVWFGAVGQ